MIFEDFVDSVNAFVANVVQGQDNRSFADGCTLIDGFIGKDFIRDRILKAV